MFTKEYPQIWQVKIWWSTFIRNLRLLENNLDWSALRCPDPEAVCDQYNAPLEYLQPTAAGIDGLPAWFVRVASPIFRKTIAYLINMSLATSTGHSATLIQTTTGLTTVSQCFGLDEWMTCLILQVSATGLHQLLACDLVQKLVYLVQLHHCTKARYAYVCLQVASKACMAFIT